MRLLRTRRLLWLVAVLSATGTVLYGCGQSGDLYLPEKPRPQEEQEQ